jgi:hypothetical protein
MEIYNATIAKQRIDHLLSQIENLKRQMRSPTLCFTDKRGVSWIRPTAEAYAGECEDNFKLRQYVKKQDDEIRRLWNTIDNLRNNEEPLRERIKQVEIKNKLRMETISKLRGINQRIKNRLKSMEAYDFEDEEPD